MPNPARAKSRARRERAWELNIRGHSERWIIGQLERDGLGKVTRGAVHYMLVKQRQIVFAELVHRTNKVKSEQTAKLMQIFNSRAVHAPQRATPEQPCATFHPEHRR